MPEAVPPNPTPARRRPADLLLIVLFLAALCLPGAVRLIGGPPPEKPMNRRPVWPPTLGKTSRQMWDFPERLAKYYSEHFALRPQLIRLHALAVYHGLRASPSSLVRIGSDGWMYYTDDNAFDDYRSRTLFTDKELAKWKEVLEQRRDWLAAQGSKYLIVFVPDKHAVYGEHIPASIRRVREEYAFEQLTKYLQENTTLDVLNLAPALDRAKQTERIYHRTDTHWNDRGAHVGYREIVNRLNTWFPGVIPLDRSQFDDVEERTPGWDLAAMIKLDDAMPEDNLALRPHQARTARFINGADHDAKWNDPVVILKKDDPTLPRAVVLRDSFFSALVPFIAEHFSHVFIVWDQQFYPNVMVREKPQVVIQEIAGRKLIQFPLYNPPELDQAATPAAAGERP